MIYHFTFLTTYLIALLLLGSLYFTKIKLKIEYLGFNKFLLSQFLISTGLFLLLYLNDTTKYYMTPIIGLLIFMGAYFFICSTYDYINRPNSDKKVIIILLFGYALYLYFLFIHESIMLQIIALYIPVAYTFLKTGQMLYKSKKANTYNITTLQIVISCIFGNVFLLRVAHAIIANGSIMDHQSLEVQQMMTAVVSFVLQIGLMFSILNRMFDDTKEGIKFNEPSFLHAPVSMIMINDRKNIIDVNHRFIELFGYGRMEMIGKRLDKTKLFKSLFKDESFRQLFDFNHNIHNKEVGVSKAGGDQKQILLSLSKVDYIEKNHAIITLTDISEIHVLKEKLSDYAYYDDLTNLPNRRYLTRYFNAKLAKNQPFGLMCIDLDNFKNINDTHGHTVGDKVLAFIAQRILNNLDDNDFIARYAGDEFIYIFDIKNTMTCLEQKAKKILHAIEEAIDFKHYIFEIKASIGISTYPKDGDTLNALIEKADKAMYSMKRLTKSKQNDEA